MRISYTSTCTQLLIGIYFFVVLLALFTVTSDLYATPKFRGTPCPSEPQKICIQVRYNSNVKRLVRNDNESLTPALNLLPNAIIELRVPQQYIPNVNNIDLQRVYPQLPLASPRGADWKDHFADVRILKNRMPDHNPYTISYGDGPGENNRIYKLALMAHIKQNRFSPIDVDGENSERIVTTITDLPDDVPILPTPPIMPLAPDRPLPAQSHCGTHDCSVTAPITPHLDAIAGALGQSGRTLEFQTPLTCMLRTSPHGWRSLPQLGRGRHLHRGVDLRAKKGTPVFAVEDGVVEIARPAGAYGHHVRIRHGKNGNVSTPVFLNVNGTSKRFDSIKTAYSHLARPGSAEHGCRAPSLRPGQVVRKGDQIGCSSDSPNTRERKYVTGPHLDFEIIINHSDATGFPSAAQAQRHYLDPEGVFNIPTREQRPNDCR